MAKIKNLTALEGFHNGLAIIAIRKGRNDLMGMINTAGEIVVEPKYHRIHGMDSGVLCVEKTATSGLCYIDHTRGRELPGPHLNGLVITVGGKRDAYGLEDTDGNTIIPHKYKRLVFADPTGNYLIAKNFRDNYGIIDARGNVLVPFAYDDIRSSNITPTDPIIVLKHGRFFAVDLSGRRLLTNDYGRLSDRSPQGYYVFGDDNAIHRRYGVIDADGQIVIPARYSTLYWIGNDRLCCGVHLSRYLITPRTLATEVQSYGVEMYGIIDSLGRTIIPMVHPFPFGIGLSPQEKCPPQGRYIVEAPNPDHTFNKDDDNPLQLFGVMAEGGQMLIPFGEQDITCEHNMFKVYDRARERFGLYSLDGDLVLPYEYDEMHIGDSSDYIAVKKNDEWFYINTLGERILL